MKQLPEGAYNFSETEARILKFWLEHGFYKPEYDPKTNTIQSTEELKAEIKQNPENAFSIILPPPNAYGRPHIGNISGYAYQDAMGRYARQQGKRTLLLPGKDHAGLEGEGVYIREVLEKEGVDKFSLGRDEFYKRMWDFNQENMVLALKDEQTIGLSADFDRNLFTLDPEIVNTVLSTFVDMYKGKLIYRGTRIINWDPKARSTIADNQCDRKEKEGEMWYLRYQIVQENTHDVSRETLSNKGDQSAQNTEYILVATARPETIWADTAVAVNPEDPRYKHLIGKKVIIPTTNREIPIITSPRVLTDFGTGCLKITPAHAQDDFTIMQEWNAQNPDKQIQAINVIGKDLKLVGPVPEQYKSRKYNQITEELATQLTELGLLEKREKIMQNKLVSERTGATVEPMISSQWFVDVESFKKPVIDMVKSGKVKIHPQNMEDKFFYWMENLRDWAISRSLWWGYRLPVWYAGEVEERINDLGNVQEFIKLPPKTELPPGVAIRKAKPEDAEAMYEIDVAGWMQNFIDEQRGITAEVLKNKYGRVSGDKQKIEEFAKTLSDPEYAFFVAEADGKVIGWADVEQINSDRIHWLNVYVDQNWQSKGVGAALMRHAIKNYSHLEIHIATPKKANMKDFYTKFGFIEYPVEGRKEGGLFMIQMKREAGLGLEEWSKLDYSNPEHVLVQPEAPAPHWIQSEDVLDTWFSSGQWPYATLKAFDLMDTFYPTSVMETGYDILENWVSRMMMFSWFTQGKEPFKDVYLHGMVLGSDGQKMSKSRKNLIPLDDAQNQYGVDALRMVYFYQNKAGASYSLSHEKLKTFRNFNNKIWNAAKFVLNNTLELSSEEISKLSQTKNFGQFNDLIESLGLQFAESDKQFANILEEQEKQFHDHFQNFRFGLLTESLYQTFWHNFCDEYIEQAKPLLAVEQSKKTSQYLLLYALRSYLKMVHPFIPHLSEEIWQHIRVEENDAKSLMYEVWN